MTSSFTVGGYARPLIASVQLRVSLLVLFAILGPASATFAQKISVKVATPNQGAQETVDLDVVIDGTGFGLGAQAKFVLSGTDNPDGIRVKNTRVVSNTQLVATIDIDATASLALFDIKVAVSGRSGKGTDLFQVVEKGGRVACVVEPLDTSRFQLVGTLNGLVNGQPRYRTALGVALVARRTTLSYGVGTRDVIVVAAGTNADTGGKVEVFFLDPVSGALLDGTALVPGGPVQPHVTISTTSIASGFAPQHLAVGDVNQDGLPDFAASQHNGGSDVGLAVATRSPAGVINYTLAPIPRPAQYGRFGLALAMGDLDNDGFDELVVAKGNYGTGKRVEHPKLLVYSAQSGVASLRQTVAAPESQTNANFGYGGHLAVGDVSGDGIADVIVASQNWTVSGLTTAGGVFVHRGTGTDPLLVQASAWILLAPSPHSGDEFGAHVATGNLDGDPDGQSDVLALDYWTGPETTGEVFAGPILSSASPSTSGLQLTLRPGLSRGWATRGAAVGDLNGDGLADIVVGAPNTPDDGSCNSIGTTYVYLAQGNAASGTTGWTRFTIQPPIVDPNFGGFGWSTATVPGSALVFIGEHGRDLGGVTMAGQVYVYRLAP